MAAPKQLLLCFMPSESGVDGPGSLHGRQASNPLAALAERAIGGLVKRGPFAIPPLALMILSSIRVEGVEQSICDLRFDSFPHDRPWDLVGIGVHTGMASRAFELADRLRANGTRVVLGGPHVTLFPDSSRPHADVLVHGEADDLWRQVQEDLRDGQLRQEYRSDAFPDLAKPRPVEKGMLKASRYFTTNLIQTGRGCPHNCDFCNVHVLNGHKLRRRRIEEVVDEVRRFSRSDRRIFFFVDDSINADPEYAEALFRRIEPFGIRWFGQATTALGRQPKLLESFARSGCRALLVGIESVEQASRRAHGKNQSRLTELEGSIRAIRAAGISLYGSFIYGLDGDTLETPAAILDFVDRTRLDVPGVNILRPTPGTRVFSRLAEEGRLLFDPSELTAFRYSFGQEMLYRPKNIPLDRFVESYSELTRRLFNLPDAVRRGIDAPAEKGAVLLFNLLYSHLYRLSRNDLRQQAGLAP